jgi:hypothetical protein
MKDSGMSLFPMSCRPFPSIGVYEPDVENRLSQALSEHLDNMLEIDTLKKGTSVSTFIGIRCNSSRRCPYFRQSRSLIQLQNAQRLCHVAGIGCKGMAQKYIREEHLISILLHPNGLNYMGVGDWQSDAR